MNGQNTETSPGDLRRPVLTRLCKRPSAYTDVKNSYGVNDTNYNYLKFLKLL